MTDICKTCGVNPVNATGELCDSCMMNGGVIYGASPTEQYFTHHSTTDDDSYSIMFHELLHTVKGCNNHGEHFNTLSKRIEEATDIKEIAGTTYTTSNEYRKDTHKTPKYLLECDECGKEYRMNRLRGGQEDGIDYRGRAVYYKCPCEKGAELLVSVLR